jgi:hypothetical protein
MIEILILIMKTIMWMAVAGFILMGAWSFYVYAFDIPSHSELTDEDEKRMIAELNSRNGIQASEIGGDHD